MTKAEMVKEIAVQTKCDPKIVTAIVQSFMGEIKDALIQGEQVNLRGFGSFILKRRAEKVGRNIAQNTAVIVPAHNIVALRPAKDLAEQICKQSK